jgi:regulator of replication initiation timing
MAASDPDRPEGGRPQPAEGGEAPGDSLRGFLKRGEAFIEEILRENETLRLRIVHLENKLHEAQTPVPAPVAAEELRSIFEKLRQEHEQLRRRLDEVADETEQYKARYQLIEDENDRLVNLFVSIYQLHSTLDFPETVQIIEEILLNFVGAGRFALFLHDNDIDRFRPLQAYGVPLEQVPDYDREQAAVAPCLETGKPVVGEMTADGWDLQQPLVSIPLTLEQDVVGLILIYSYLEQKAESSPIDQELFGLLGDHGGLVIEAARLAAEVSGDPNRYRACVRLMSRGEENHA